MAGIPMQKHAGVASLTQPKVSACPPQEHHRYFERWWPAIEEQIERVVHASRGPSPLWNMTEYQMSTGGKRLRALLPLQVAQALGGRPEKVVPFAAACEVLHNASLVLDDIQDGDLVRRDRETVWQRFGMPQGINAGMAMLYYAPLLVQRLDVESELRERVLHATVQETLEVIRGQSLEIAVRDASEITWDQYVEIVECKTGGFFALPLVGAAILSEAPEEVVIALGESARHLSVLFQIQDDIADLWGEKGRGIAGNDIREGKPSALVAFALEAATEAQADWLKEVLSRPRETTTPTDVAEVTRFFETCGARTRALTEILERRDLATSAFSESPLHALIKGVADLMLASIASLIAEREQMRSHDPNRIRALRRATVSDPVELLKQATAASLRTNAERFMPQSPYRDFLLWALDSTNPHHEPFLQCTGATQTAKMNVLALKGLVGVTEWPQIAPYIGRINAYQSFEVVSDNLAIQLAPLRRRTGHGPQRLKLLDRFNELAQKKLLEPDWRAADALKELASLSSGLSLFEQSLVPDKLRALAEAFVAERGGDVSEIESAIAIPLVANIETCWNMVESTRGLPLFEVTRQGEIERYSAVNALLRGTDRSHEELAETGLRSILVVPTLSYYIDALAQLRGESPSLEAHREPIVQLLRAAAMQVRLLNDLGTALLKSDDDTSADLVTNALRMGSDFYEASGGDVRKALLAGVSSCDTLTRLHKDLEFGEFNVGLWGIEESCSWDEAVIRFHGNLSFFRAQYQKARTRMFNLAAELRDEVPAAVEPSVRFVEFHVKLYHHDFSKASGEYAI